MAGNGSRFKQAGINEEKYKLQIKEQTMFEYALESLRAFFDHEFVFITRKEHESRSFISEKCAALGIEKFEIVEIERLTSGQATTALKAEPYVDPADAVVIYNIDTYVANGHLSPEVLEGDGCIPVFEAESGSWSFVAVDESGQATEVVEKTPISDLASLGLYHFDRFESVKEAFEARGKQVEIEYGERYIAPLYNWLIDQDYNVTIQTVPRSDIHILGTPDDVVEFDPEFATRYSL